MQENSKNCAFMNFETAYTLFDSFQIKYVTDLTEPQKYVSLLTIRTKDGADPKEVANTINTKMRDSGLKAYTAKAMSGKVSDYLLKLQIKVQKCFTNLHTYVLIK